MWIVLTPFIWLFLALLQCIVKIGKEVHLWLHWAAMFWHKLPERLDVAKLKWCAKTLYFRVHGSKTVFTFSVVLLLWDCGNLYLGAGRSDLCLSCWSNMWSLYLMLSSTFDCTEACYIAALTPMCVHYLCFIHDHRLRGVHFRTCRNTTAWCCLKNLHMELFFWSVFCSFSLRSTVGGRKQYSPGNDIFC